MDSVDWLLNQARRYPLLTAEQEIELGRQVKDWLALRDQPNHTPLEAKRCKRGLRAYQTFFNCNIRLVVKCAGWFSRKTCSLGYDDLISEGMLGLHHAIKKFEPAKGYKFSTYAVWWIRQAISRAIDTKASMIYMSGSAQQLARRAFRYIAEQEQRTGKRPSLEELAEKFKTPIANLRNYLAHTPNLISLDAPVLNTQNRDTYLIDLIEDPSSNLQVDELSELHALLPVLLADLQPTEQDILKRRHMLDEIDTYNTLANDYGVSRERVRQIHDRALRKMRQKLMLHGHAPTAAPEQQCA